jgi:hypothetical protein
MLPNRYQAANGGCASLVVHHEVVDENEPAGNKRVKGAPGEEGDVRASHRAPDKAGYRYVWSGTSAEPSRQ